MFCMKCQHDLSECTCPDLQERLKKATAGAPVAIKWCRRCDKSYHACHCERPGFYVRGGSTGAARRNLQADRVQPHAKPGHRAEPADTD